MPRHTNPWEELNQERKWTGGHIGRRAVNRIYTLCPLLRQNKPERYRQPDGEQNNLGHIVSGLNARYNRLPFSRILRLAAPIRHALQRAHSMSAACHGPLVGDPRIDAAGNGA
jgi:hypothetical protein